MQHTDGARASGFVEWEITGPDGRVKDSGVERNLITQVGDQYYWERGAGIGGAPAQVTGIKLGTGTTAPSKTGSGAALATYLADSHQAIAVGYPAASLVSGKRRISWRAIYAAGKATGTSNEAALVNEALTDATSGAAATIARIVFSTPKTKDAEDTLTLTWHHELLGS